MYMVIVIRVVLSIMLILMIMEINIIIAVYEIQLVVGVVCTERFIHTDNVWHLFIGRIDVDVCHHICLYVLCCLSVKG